MSEGKEKKGVLYEDDKNHFFCYNEEKGHRKIFMVRDINQSDDVKTDISSTEHDQNLMIVYAVEGYSKRHNLPEKDVIVLFRKHGINSLIRKNYNALHTQDFDESISFAEDVLLWKQN